MRTETNVDNPHDASGRAALPSRRGVTFLEVVLGVVLLGMVAGTLASVVGVLGGSFQRQRDRLAAAELASRLLLIRIDDEDAMPDPSLPIGYGNGDVAREFRWTIDERPVLINLSEPAQASLEASPSRSMVDLSRRVRAVTVTTWLAEASGGSYTFDPELPSATLTRFVDPIAFSTYDSSQRRLETQEDFTDFLGDFIGTTTAGGGVGAAQQGGGGRSGGGGGRRSGGGG